MSGAPRLDGIAFFGGGTGGHVFPGIAVAERARERFPDCEIVFFRTGRTVEDRAFAGRDFEVRILELGAPGRRPSGWLRYGRGVSRGARAIRARLGRGRWAAFGLGGYASVPGILAARARRVPLILLEQNRVAGRANLLLAPFAAAVACSFPDTRIRPGRRAVTGNPVRREVLRAAAARRARPADGARRTVLVVGGSQGAHGLNEALRRALPGLRDLAEKIRFTHLAGDADKEDMEKAYREEGFEAEVYGYSERLPELMARADLAIGRAGGTTLAEIAVVGLPAILVPYPYHRDLHQRRNAEAFVEAGAARILEERDLDAGSLRKLFDETLAPGTLEAMERGAFALARPEAADAVLDLALEVLRT